MAKDDPVVERVREVRRRIAARCGQNPRKLFEWAKKIEAGQSKRVVGYGNHRKPRQAS